MIWPILITATLASVLVAVLCAAFGIRRLPIVVSAQVLVAFAVSFGVSVAFTRVWEDATAGVEEPNAIWLSLIAAIAIPATWTVLALILGPPLERRRMRASSR